jgi:hypothetical protein
MRRFLIFGLAFQRNSDSLNEIKEKKDEAKKAQKS